MTYAILFHPGHNRIYYETSLKLSVAEFSIVAQNFSSPCENIRCQRLSGIEYLTFETRERLTSAELSMVSELSFLYALFELAELPEGIFLKPIEKSNVVFVEEGIGGILKYPGKTNETFTRMLINLAYYSQENRENICLLDPIAGKGTTLYEGLVKGFHVYGIEIGETPVNEAYHFLKRFLETARYKFEYNSLKLSGPKKSFSAQRHTFQTAKTKVEWKQKNTHTIELVAGNSLYANKYYKKDFFDLLVGDLPYGVQHGNVTKENQSSLTRNPTELLNTCLPAWREVLKPMGTIALAWNCHVLPRQKMEYIFEELGFAVKRDTPYLQFEHRVDQSILRDIIVARKDG